MADRGSFRGGRGRGGGYGRGGQRGGGIGGGAYQQPQSQQQQEKPKKESILDLSKYMDKDVKVKFSGGRVGAYSSIVPLYAGWSWLTETVSGILKGFDQLMNLVLDEVKESMRGRNLSYAISVYVLTIPDDEGNETTRALGLVVARGTLIVLISPADGSEEIANPFVQE